MISKRKSLDERLSRRNRKKYPDLSGFCENIKSDRIKNIGRYFYKGDWQRDRIIRISYKNCRIIKKNQRQHLVIKTPVPRRRLDLWQNYNQHLIDVGRVCPCPSKSISNWKKADFSAKEFTVEVSFSGKYSTYIFLFQLL